MGTRSASRTALLILGAFLRQRTWRQSELAARVGVESETIRRHMLELQREGVPLERSDEGPTQVFWSVPPQWVPSGVVLDESLLEHLLRLLVRTPSSPLRAELVRRLGRSLPHPEVWTRRLAIVVPGDLGESADILDELEDSAAEQRAVRVRYYSASRGELAWRVVSVQRVVDSERFAAFCHRDKGLKWFRVDAVTDVATEPAPEPYERRPPEEVDAMVQASVGGFVGAEAVRALVFWVRSPESRWVVRNLPGGDATHAPEDGGERVTVRTNAVRAIARFVVGLGGAARAETPELRAEVELLAREALAASGGEGASSRTEDQCRPTSGGVGGRARSEGLPAGARVASTVPSPMEEEG